MSSSREAGSSTSSWSAIAASFAPVGAAGGVGERARPSSSGRSRDSIRPSV